MRGSAILIAFTLVAAGLAGCIGEDEIDPTSSDDPVDESLNNETPSYELPSAITGMAPVANVEHGSAGGLVIHEDHAFVSGLGDGFYVLNVSDPQAPEKIAHLEELYARDADVLTLDGRTIVALAAGGAGLHLVDVTDPTSPTPTVTEFDVGASVHNLVTVPGTPYIYNSRSLGDPVEPGIDIIDVSDPANPTVETVWTFPRTGASGSPIATTGCHDITVYPDADRAYCAGVTQTYIMGIEDPLDPTVEGTVTNPAINIHHWALATDDHGTLIIGDEFAGAAGPSSCLAHQSTPAGDVSQPYGAVWFYDISDPSAPVPQGHVSAPIHEEPRNVCTAHFGEIIEDRDKIAVGWYTAGVLLVDFADPMAPTLVSQWAEGTNVWDVRYHNGHLITGDIGHGTDVLRLTGS